jgi:RHS repeat-associated protein
LLKTIHKIVLPGFARRPSRFQIEDGLAYNWHRTYDATLGRYSQADPLGFVDGPGVYGYAGGSPVMGVDPRGLMELPSDPSGLPDGWNHDPIHRPPGGGSKWRGPSGGCLEFSPGQPGAPGYGGKDHWHDCTDPDDKPRKRKHRSPGDMCPLPEDNIPPEPKPTPLAPIKPEPWWFIPLLIFGGLVGSQA